MDEYIKKTTALSVLFGKGKELSDGYYLNLCHGGDRCETEEVAIDVYYNAGKLIQNIPAADVVEVIRCRDCKWFTKDGLCFVNVKGVGYMKPAEDHFCSYGERKDGAENDG